MKRILQTVFMFCILSAGLINQVLAVSAYPYPVQVKQPDGTTITVIMQGDERVKWAQTMDGYTIMYNKKGVFEYAMQDSKGDLTLSGVPASEISLRKSDELNFLSKISKGLLYSKDQVSLMKSIYEIKSNEAQKVFPTTGSRKLICILMGYKDKAFTKTQAEFNNLYNQVGYTTGGATGSVKDFYLESSYGQFDLTVTVAGPYTAANNMSYYGGNDASGNDSNPRALVSEAINAADASVNFADFDNDGDGTVDGVYIIYAGYGEEAGAGADCIWAHAWNLATAVTKDGKSISKYSCSAELSGTSGTTMTRIGVICHEFGHVLGAPDYYDTNYATGGQFDGTGKWDLMAGGSWNNSGITPAQHNAYTKVKVYGWATATVLSSASNVSVSPAVTNRSFYQINSTTANEYWILENRQQSGFDTNIPGHGLLIYHVHKDIGSAGNAINATYPQKMYPVCANATSNPGSTASTYGTINGAGCPFPGSGAKTSFTDATTPNMKSWAGANTAKPITSIVENADKTITFSFMGGVVDPTAPTATTVAASSITNSGATLNATVNANNASTTVTFEYGTTTSYGSTINGTPNTVTGATATSITAALTGLAANTTYNFRVKAVNSVGTTYGNNLTFTTTNTTITVPTVTTTSASNIASTSATSGGNVTADGGASVTERGICYATTQNPTTANSKVVSGTGTGAYTSNLTGLTANTTYYVRAYAINSSGTAYGSQVSFTTLSGGGTVDVTIGTGTSTQGYPINCYYGYERSASIYTATEVGKVGSISKVAWYPTLTTTYNVPVKIYIKQTTATTLTATTWASSISGATLVYSGTMAGTTANAWKEFTLSTAFNFTGGTNNLMVLVETNYGGTGAGSSTGAAVRYTSATSKHMYIRADNSAPTGNGTVSSYRPNVKITITTSATSPNVDINNLTETNNITLSVYPNPTKDKVTVESNGEVKSIEIYTITGAKIYSRTENLNNSYNEVDLSTFQNGLYILVVNDGVKRHKMKVIKQ